MTEHGWTDRHEALYERLAEYLSNYDDKLVRDAIANGWSFEETIKEGEERDAEHKEEVEAMGDAEFWLDRDMSMNG